MFKKILVISLLLGSIILTGCSQKDELSKGEIFEKKKECAKLSEEMQEDIDSLRPGIYFQLGKVYYSANRDSCIYTVKGDKEENVAVIDFFSKEVLYSILNQYCGTVNGKIEIAKTKDLEPFEGSIKSFDIDYDNIVGTDEPDCVKKIKEKYTIGTKILDLR